MSKLALLLLLLASTISLLVGASHAQTVTTIVSNGPPSELYDMVIIGDGYRASEQSQFDQDAIDVVDYFRNTPDKYPYDAYFHLYNVHTVFRASNDSGADKPPLGIFRDTVYDATYWFGGTERCLYVQNTEQASQDAALAPDSDGRVIVLVNDNQYGGCGGQFSVSYNGSAMRDVQAHEWGHSFGGLADEYDYGRNGPYTGPEPTGSNCTASTTGSAKWPLWVGIPGIYGTVGAYPGACYYPPTPLPTLYRPEPDCEMRNLNRKFCAICREQFIKKFNQLTQVLGAPSPSPTSLVLNRGDVQVFSFTNRISNRPHSIEWLVDDVLQPAQGTSFTWDTSGASRSIHRVKVRLVDSSPDVRSDPLELLVHERVWTINLGVCSGQVQYYGGGCTGSLFLAPWLTTLGTPQIPGSLDVYVYLARPSQPAILMLGSSRTTFAGAIPLPLDLAGFGMPSCTLQQSWNLGLPASVGATGSSMVTLQIPDDPSLDGQRLYLQWLCVDPTANALGATVSSSAEVVFCY